MKNYHQPTKLISMEEINKIEKVLFNSWSNETTDPENKDAWTVENKALGQCAPTSLLIFDMFGGQLIYDKTNFHIWNELPDGSQQDFTRSQFITKRKFSIYKYKTKADVLYDKRGIETKLERRYEILKQHYHLFYKNI